MSFGRKHQGEFNAPIAVNQKDNDRDLFEQATGISASPVQRSLSGDRRGEAWRVALVQVQSILYGRIDSAAAARLPREELNRQIPELIGEIVDEQRISLSVKEQSSLAMAIIDDMIGLGPMEALLRDNAVTDIMVNGPRQIYVEKRGKLELTDIQFRDNAHVMNVAQK